jgi:hypothetical protein
VNTFNRVVLVLLCLILMFGAAALTALTWLGPTETIDQLRDTAAWLDERNTDGSKFIITTASVVVAMMALTLLVIELYPRSKGQVRVSDLQIGDAVLSTSAVAQRVEEAVTHVPNVADVRATVTARRKGIALNLDLHVDPDANLATVIDDASEAARIVLTEKVHVALAEPPRTRIHYRELRLHSRPVRRPTIARQTFPEHQPVVEDEPDDALPEVSAAAAVPSPEPAEAPIQREEETAVKA